MGSRCHARGEGRTEARQAASQRHGDVHGPGAPARVWAPHSMEVQERAQLQEQQPAVHLGRRDMMHLLASGLCSPATVTLSAWLKVVCVNRALD